jgi:hypothetical protein
LLLLPLSLFVTMPRQQCFRHGSATAFLFTGADTHNSNGGASKQLRPLDESTKMSPYVWRWINTWLLWTGKWAME